MTHSYTRHLSKSPASKFGASSGESLLKKLLQENTTDSNCLPERSSVFRQLQSLRYTVYGRSSILHVENEVKFGLPHGRFQFTHVKA